MNDSPELSEVIPDPEDVRTEYAAIASFHETLVNSRFTIAGLYVAATGFLAGAVFGDSATWLSRAVIAGLACWLTTCLWILELRSRSLFTNIAHRAIDIEHRYWHHTGKDWLSPFFSRAYKEPPNHPADAELTRRTDPDRPTLGWAAHPMSISLSKFISHSLGLDLLYVGGELFWIGMLVVSVIVLVVQL